MKTLKKHLSHAVLYVGLPLFCTYFVRQAVDQLNTASDVITQFCERNCQQ